MFRGASPKLYCSGWLNPLKPRPRHRSHKSFLLQLKWGSMFLFGSIDCGDILLASGSKVISRMCFLLSFGLQTGYINHRGSLHLSICLNRQTAGNYGNPTFQSKHPWVSCRNSQVEPTHVGWSSCVGSGGTATVCVCACCPLVNIQKTMENHHFQWVNPL